MVTSANMADRVLEKVLQWTKIFRIRNPWFKLLLYPDRIFALRKTARKRWSSSNLSSITFPTDKQRKRDVFFEKLPLYWQSFGWQKSHPGIIVTWTKQYVRHFQSHRISRKPSWTKVDQMRLAVARKAISYRAILLGRAVVCLSPQNLTDRIIEFFSRKFSWICNGKWP